MSENNEIDVPQLLNQFVNDEIDKSKKLGMPTVIKIQLSGVWSADRTQCIAVTNNDILNWAELIKKDNPDMWFIRQFVGETLWPEIVQRREDGQTYGQAFMNAGDRFDRPYSWQLDWRLVHGLDSWKTLADHVRSVYGTPEFPKAFESLDGRL